MLTPSGQSPAFDLGTRLEVAHSTRVADGPLEYLTAKSPAKFPHPSVNRLRRTPRLPIAPRLLKNATPRREHTPAA